MQDLRQEEGAEVTESGESSFTATDLFGQSQWVTTQRPGQTAKIDSSDYSAGYVIQVGLQEDSSTKLNSI